MNELAPIIFNEVKEAQKELSSLGAHVVNMSFPTEYPWHVFTSSQSWTVPEDGEYEIIVIGGGHPAGGSSAGHGAGGGGPARGDGGGAGGLSIHQSFPLQKGQSVVVTVGAPGGNSTVVCPDASLDMIANGAKSRTGGTASGGELNFTGGSGGPVSNPSTSEASAGGGGGGLFTSHGTAGKVESASISAVVNQSLYLKPIAAVGGDGGDHGGGPGVASVLAANGAVGSSTLSMGTNYTATVYYAIGSSAFTSSQGKRGGSGWLARIPGYCAAGVNGTGLVAIRRVR